MDKISSSMHITGIFLTDNSSGSQHSGVSHRPSLAREGADRQYCSPDSPTEKPGRLLGERSVSVQTEGKISDTLRVDIKDSPSISKGYSGLNQQERTNIELSLWVHGYRPVARDGRSIPPKSLRHKKTSLMSTLRSDTSPLPNDVLITEILQKLPKEPLDKDTYPTIRKSSILLQLMQIQSSHYIKECACVLENSLYKTINKPGDRIPLLKQLKEQVSKDDYPLNEISKELVCELIDNSIWADAVLNRIYMALDKKKCNDEYCLEHINKLWKLCIEKSDKGRLYYENEPGFLARFYQGIAYGLDHLFSGGKLDVDFIVKLASINGTHFNLKNTGFTFTNHNLYSFSIGRIKKILSQSHCLLKTKELEEILPEKMKYFASLALSTLDNSTNISRCNYVLKFNFFEKSKFYTVQLLHNNIRSRFEQCSELLDNYHKKYKNHAARKTLDMLIATHSLCIILWLKQMFAGGNTRVFYMSLQFLLLLEKGFWQTDNFCRFHPDKLNACFILPGSFIIYKNVKNLNHPIPLMQKTEWKTVIPIKEKLRLALAEDDLAALKTIFHTDESLIHLKLNPWRLKPLLIAGIVCRTPKTFEYLLKKASTDELIELKDEIKANDFFRINKHWQTNKYQTIENSKDILLNIFKNKNKIMSFFIESEMNLIFKEEKYRNSGLDWLMDYLIESTDGGTFEIPVYRYEDEMTILHCACKYNIQPLLGALLRHQETFKLFHMQDKKENTPIKYIIVHADVSRKLNSIKYILESQKVKESLLFFFPGDSLLHYATYYQANSAKEKHNTEDFDHSEHSYSVIKIILSHELFHSLLVATNQNGETPVHIACKNNLLDVFKLFLDYWQGRHVLLMRHLENNTLIHLLFRNSELNDFSSYALTTQEGRSALLAQNKQGETPFLIACKTKNIALVEEIMKYPEGRDTLYVHDKDHQSPATLYPEYMATFRDRPGNNTNI